MKPEHVRELGMIQQPASDAAYCCVTLLCVSAVGNLNNIASWSFDPLMHQSINQQTTQVHGGMIS
jgi:hypothetical protein